MQAHQLSPSYFVSPQISEADMAEISSAGFKSIICNRPDCENPHEFQIATLRAAALKFGLQFAENTFDGSNFGMDKINLQKELIEKMPGPVLAYCTSGARSSVVWAFLSVDTIEVDEILAAAGAAGYQLTHLKPQLEELSASQSQE